MAVAQSLQGLGSMRVVTLSVVGVLLFAAFGFLALRLTSPVMSPLYTNLSVEDAGAIAAELGAMGVDFQVAANGSQILVQSSEILNVRMALAQKGLPNKGSIVGYEIFDKDTPLGTSNFVMNVNLIRALEGELGRTIGSLGSIKSARVHLVVPKPGVFEKGRLDSSASVVLTLNNITNFPKNEADAVKHLVASAVPGLKSSRVTIVDNAGNILARGTAQEEEEGGASGITASNAEEFRGGYEQKLKKTIESLLEQTVGIGRVKAQVTAEIGFDRIVTNKEEYDPDGQVARSIETSEEIASASEGGGGDVSVANNLPGGAAGGAGGAQNDTQKTDSVTNFEISKTITNHISEVGSVKRVSVAVLVDGKYEVNAETQEKKYVPRTDEEIDRLRALVQSAIGFDAKRGDVIEISNMQFSDETGLFITEEGAFDWLKRDLDSILKTVVVGIVAILAIMLVIRPLVNRAFEITHSDIEAESTAASGATSAPVEEIDLDIIQSKVDSSPARKVNDLVQSNPEETLAVIRGWLSQKA